MESIKNNLIIFGAEYLIFFLIALAIIFLWNQPRKKQKEMLFLILISFPLVFVMARMSSLFFYSPRPFVVNDFSPLVSHLADNGFPSDHMLLSSAIAAVIFLYSKKMGLFFLSLALAVGFSRVLAGVHHGIDIIGSLGIALVIVFLIKQFIIPIIAKSSIYKKYV